ncbi:MAG: hypothetical protein ACKO45_03140 [Cyanobium sp.]
MKARHPGSQNSACGGKEFACDLYHHTADGDQDHAGDERIDAIPNQPGGFAILAISAEGGFDLLERLFCQRLLGKAAGLGIPLGHGEDHFVADAENVQIVIRISLDGEIFKGQVRIIGNPLQPSADGVCPLFR